GCTVLMCSCTGASLPSGYWSSTTFALFTGVAWAVDFDFGLVLVGSTPTNPSTDSSGQCGAARDRSSSASPATSRGAGRGRAPRAPDYSPGRRDAVVVENVADPNGRAEMQLGMALAEVSGHR